jgi:hypothetical protein
MIDLASEKDFNDFIDDDVCLRCCCLWSSWLIIVDIDSCFSKGKIFELAVAVRERPPRWMFRWASSDT